MAGTRAGGAGKMNVNISDEDAAAMLRLVLAYEAGVRGRTLGQACYELVMEAADTDSYPPEVRERLADIEADSRRRAVAKSLEMGAPGPGAPPGGGGEGGAPCGGGSDGEAGAPAGGE